MLEQQAAAAKARGVTVVGGATGKTKLGKTRTGWHGASLVLLLYTQLSLLLLLLLEEFANASLGCSFIPVVSFASEIMNGFELAALHRDVFLVLADVNANGTTMNVRDVAFYMPQIMQL